MHVGSVKLNSSIKYAANITEILLTIMQYSNNECQDNLANVKESQLHNPVTE